MMTAKTTQTVLGVIPARYGARRFPGKPLAQLCGKPMIQHVYEGARTSKLLTKLIVANDHEEIAQSVRNCGGEVIMTPTNIATGTDRVAYVADKMPVDIIVNIQGDEPTIRGALLDDLIEPLLANPAIPVATLARTVKTTEELINPNFARIVIDKNGYALYFTRAVVPYQRDIADQTQWIKHHTYYKHIGMYAFRKHCLMSFVQMDPSPLEKAESLEQMRLLENGYRIKIVLTKHDSHTVETPEDLETLESLLAMQTTNAKINTIS